MHESVGHTIPSTSAQDRARAAQEAGDDRTAFTHLRSAARLGDHGAWLNLGFAYDEGVGTVRSKHEAMRWYACAVRAGQSGAASNLAILFRERHNDRLMFRWFQRSARMDDGDSFVELAKCHRDGLGTPRWRSRAIDCARRAARSKHVSQAGREEAWQLLASL